MMTDTDATGQAPVESDSTEATDEAPPEQTDDDGAQPEPNRTEAKLRKRARAAETKLAVAESVVAELNREIAQDIAAQRLVNGEEIWHATDVADLTDVSGRLDRDKLGQAIDGLLEAKPYLMKRNAPPASVVSGDGHAPSSETRSFEQAFGARRH